VYWIAPRLHVRLCSPLSQVTSTVEFARIWWDKHAKHPSLTRVSFWRAVPPPGYVVLGDAMVTGKYCPPPSVLVVRDIDPSEAVAGQPPLLARPIKCLQVKLWKFAPTWAVALHAALHPTYRPISYHSLGCTLYCCCAHATSAPKVMCDMHACMHANAPTHRSGLMATSAHGVTLRTLAYGCRSHLLAMWQWVHLQALAVVSRPA
jgi:hypothetical protein